MIEYICFKGSECSEGPEYELMDDVCDFLEQNEEHLYIATFTPLAGEYFLRDGLVYADYDFKELIKDVLRALGYELGDGWCRHEESFPFTPGTPLTMCVDEYLDVDAHATTVEFYVAKKSDYLRTLLSTDEYYYSKKKAMEISKPFVLGTEAVAYAKLLNKGE